MTNVKRPVMLQVKSLQDNSCESDFSNTSTINNSENNLNDPRKRKRPPHKSRSLIIGSPSCESAPSNYRSSIQTNYFDNNSLDDQNSDCYLSECNRIEKRQFVENVNTPSSCSSSTATSSCSSSSSSSSCSSPGPADCDSPSLILPYLYVGNQAQTQIDTISSLDISYVLSLQSLPKFLDTDNKDNSEAAKGLKTISDKQENGIDKNSVETKEQKPIISIDGTNTSNEPALSNATKGVLPLVNSSKDYLIKISSSVNRLIKGKCINISDTFEQLVDKFFDETHNFIEEARRNKCNVLIHCKAGISRSPTIAIAYLMKWKRLHLHDAYNFVKRCRPQISPNLNFMGQLVSYERQLLQCGDRSQLPSPSSCLLKAPSESIKDGEHSNDSRHNYHKHKNYY